MNKQDAKHLNKSKKVIMNKLLLSLSIASLSTAVFAGSGTQWSYSGKKGPDNWAQLSADYYACNGKSQSPVNLTGFIETDLTPIEFDYLAGGNEVLNNGHTIQVNYQAGSGIKLDGKTFELKQFHFHAPSENHIKGESFPLEAHYVHAASDGELAVVAVMFREGAKNEVLQKAWKGMPKKAGEKIGLYENIQAANLLPDNKDYYRFTGSLTTPPCSEGVRWHVLKDSLEASKEQIDLFTHTLGHDNNRPIQSLNDREVLE